MTQTMNVTDVRQQFSKLLNQVYRGESHVVVEKSGIPVAGIISARDMELFKELEAQREADFQALYRIGEAFKGQAVEELEQEVAKAVQTARQERRKESGTARQV